MRWSFTTYLAPKRSTPPQRLVGGDEGMEPTLSLRVSVLLQARTIRSVSPLYLWELSEYVPHSNVIRHRGLTSTGFFHLEPDVTVRGCSIPSLRISFGRRSESIHNE